jgi:hypothetical protein
MNNDLARIEWFVQWLAELLDATGLPELRP